jgi:hypothetical protein
MIRLASCLLLLVALAGCGAEGSHEQASTAPPPIEQAAAPPAPEPTAPTPPPTPAPTPVPSGSLVATAKILPGSGEGFEAADEYTRQFHAGELDALFKKFSSEMKTVMTIEQLRQNQLLFTQQFGPEVLVVDRESKTEGEHRAFMRWARFQKRSEVVGFQWILNADDTIAGFFVHVAKPPEAPTPAS